MKKATLWIPAAAWALLTHSSGSAESPPDARYHPDRSRAPLEAVEAWKDLRFGMFIHWGPVALTGHEIGWSRGNPTPIEEYDNLCKRFNPVRFDADEWVRIAKTAGMKYIVLTTKHHDGFCLWPSEYTDYDIAATPFKRDVVGELASACRKGGIGFGTYYSTCDWWHPLYPKGSPGGKTDKPSPDLPKYIEYLKAQAAELVENYGPLTTMWFDVPREVYEEDNESTVVALRKLQPDLMINNRAYKSKDPAYYVADYDTPEQRVGGFERARPWESCMTIAGQWAWKSADPVKPLDQCLRGLLSTIGGDGNFLFNVGPDAQGVIEPEQVDRLREMGQWIARYAEGIDATRGGPFMPSGWGASTHKGRTVYLFVYRWPEKGALLLPLTDAELVKAENLSGESAELTRVQNGYALSVPERFRDPVATVIRLTCSADAASIAPVPMPSLSGSLAFQKPAAESSSYFRGRPADAFDDNPDSQWQSRNTAEEWLEVDLQEPQTVGRVRIIKDHAPIRELALQYRHNETWKSVFIETDVTGNVDKTFESITAQHFRLLMKGGPFRITEFQLYPPE